MKYLKGVLTMAICLAFSCSGGESGGNEPDPEPQPRIDPPSAASLVFPENNTECTEGVPINEQRSRITFQWNASQNTDSYQLVLRDLDLDSESTFSSNTDEAEVTVNRGTPYEWYVISEADGISQTATSPTWRFYNEGPGVENYAPFPALAIAPPRGAIIDPANTVNLQWEGSDVDEDILEYEVFFGTDALELVSLGSTEQTQIEAVISADTRYFWVVVTTDQQGNTSESERFEFKVR